MDDVKLRLNGAVAAQLNAAPASSAKEELIEELSDNLYRRFLDMTGAGVPEEEAFKRALDDLGDVDELLRYLGVEPAAAPDVIIKDGDSQARIKTENGQTRITTEDGQTIIINNPDGDPIIINTVEDDETQPQDAPQGQTDQRGGAQDGHSGQIPQSDLDAILAGVQEACNIAIDQAKSALKQAKDAFQRRTTVEKEKGRVKVHFNTQPNGATPPAPPEPPMPPEPPTPPRGWEFEAELNSGEGRFFAGGGPKERKDVIYGFGYDKDKGGFYAQWGECEGGVKAGGPHFQGVDASMRHNDDDSYSVTALKDLRGIEVVTGAGDVTFHLSEASDAGVIIDGDVDDLDVTCSADGVLTIREGRTASSSFFSRRGFSSADVELFLPRRHWELIMVSTASGDVEFDPQYELDAGQLTVKTASGDLNVRLSACGELNFKSASGDLAVEGACAVLHAETMSGDISLQGEVAEADLRSVSGSIELDGAAVQFRGSSVSGDVQVKTAQLPQTLELSSKSGDLEASIPDAAPFSLRMKTVSGEMRCEFPTNYVNGLCVYGDGSGPTYSMTSVSGDVSLGRR